MKKELKQKENNKVETNQEKLVKMSKTESYFCEKINKINKLRLIN